MKMADIIKKCVHAFRCGNKKESLQLLSTFYQPETIRDQDDWNRTLVHYATMRGWDDVCKLLVEKYHYDPSATDRNGETPLHLACVSGSVPTVKYLLSLPSVIRSINVRSEMYGTPLSTACRFEYLQIIELLLSTTPSINISIKSLPISTYKYAVLSLLASRIDWSSEVTVQPYFNVFMTGNTDAGKSTLAAVTMELTKFSSSRHDQVTCVATLTAGVCPTQCGRKLYPWENEVKSLALGTNIEIYDLAGHADYYSSHAAMLESLCLESPAVFVMMVDISKDKEQLRKELYYWSNFLEIQSSSILSHVIVVGSRKDKLCSEPQLLTSKSRYVENIIKKAFEKQQFAGFVALDSRQLSPENVLPFLKILAKSVNELIDPEVHERISFACFLLREFLRERVKVNAISFDSLQKRVYSDSTLSPLSDPEKLTSSLAILAKKGFILFLRNNNHLFSSCIVLDKMKLLQEINGCLFAPTSFKEHLPIASNRGIVPVTLLHQSFPHYGHDILVVMMTALQFCRPVNTEFASSKQLLYFPALVSAERPDDLSISDGLGWCMYCTHPHKFLTRRCFDVLMLDLADKFCLTFPPPLDVEEANEAAVRELSRYCTVWTNGIYWETNDGIKAMVQLTEENRCISLLLSLDQESCIEGLELCSSVIATIRSKQKQYCSSVEVSEYLIDSSQLPQICHSSFSQLTVFEMKDVARSIVLEKKFVFDIKRKQKLRPESLLVYDPFQVLPLTIVRQLYASKKSSEPTPPSLLKKIRDHFRKISIPENSTLESVQEQLSKFSVFAGRNLFELAGVSAADLPPPPPLPNSSTDILPEGALDSSHLPDLFEGLHHIVDWKKLGLYLGVSYSTLQKIKLNEDGVDNCKMAMLYHWLCSGTANKQTLLTALKKMGESLYGRVN